MSVLNIEIFKCCHDDDNYYDNDSIIQIDIN